MTGQSARRRSMRRAPPADFALQNIIIIVVVVIIVVQWWFDVVVGLVSINEVNLRRARLILKWVTVSGSDARRGAFISVFNQPPRSTQPGHPFVGRRNEYQPKGGGDALWLGSKGRHRSYVGGR